MSLAEGAGEQAALLAEVGRGFDQLRDLLMSAGTGPPDPDRMVRFAARAVPHSAHAGLTLTEGRRRPVTLAGTGEQVALVDAIQYDVNEGPCLEAVAGHDVARAADLTSDLQWPRFARRCVAETKVRSMFSVRLFLTGDARAALNFYAERPHAFDDMDVAVGSMFGPFAALAVRAALQEREIETLQMALDASRQIGTAIGILMARQLVSREQAFAQLVSASQHLNRKLRDIAADVEATGELPGGPPAGAGRSR